MGGGPGLQAGLAAMEAPQRYDVNPAHAEHDHGAWFVSPLGRIRPPQS